EDLKDSLKIATEIQQGLLPDTSPDVPGYAFCAFVQSCYSVGGDYYDFITLPDGRIWLVIADVAGKGYPAALTVANLHAMLHVLATENVPFDKAVDYINKALFQSLAGGRFVTLFMAKLLPDSHSLLWLNAGHVPPMLLTDAGVERLHASTPPLGMMPEISIKPQRIKLRTGDLLLAYTDGVTEARSARGRDASGEMFGDQRLADWLVAHRKSRPVDLPGQLLKTLKLFGQTTQEDDITLLCLQRE
ncbi:MAG: PP2C family protein-serine/threonine phosphatase, partial [Mariprofundaceae bacterium]|nr:PP2C family protein-serine/threonine phosphatase [Mariprofundaceae bacterium]